MADYFYSLQMMFTHIRFISWSEMLIIEQLADEENQ